MSDSHLHVNNKRKVTEVLVARWSDGTSLWRSYLDHELSTPESMNFCFRGPVVDDDENEACFVVRRLQETLMAPTTKAGNLDPVSRHGRWVLERLGVLQPRTSPVWKQTFALSDRFVAGLSMRPEVVLSEARRLDGEIDRVYASAGIGKVGFRWKRLVAGERNVFAELCKEGVGTEDLVDEVLDFLDGLLVNAWVRINPVQFRRTGDLRPKLFCPESPSSKKDRWTDSSVLHGWALVSSLDLGRPRGGWTLEKLVQFVLSGAASSEDGDGARYSAEHAPRAFLVLAEPEYSAWFEKNTKVGRFSLPDDELELYDMLGEPVPYLWPSDRLAEWAAERWPEELRPWWLVEDE